MSATTITLPGPPVAYAVEPARLVAWLVERGWQGCAEEWCNPRRYTLTKPRLGEPTRRYVVEVLRDGEGDAVERQMFLLNALEAAAESEDIEARELAAQCCAPADGPALQWAHASADTRATVLLHLDAEANDHRVIAGVLRERGETEKALDREGRAMGLEAAAAVLRGGGR